MSYKGHSHKFRLYKAMSNTSITIIDFDLRHFKCCKTKSLCTWMMPGQIGIGPRHRIAALAETGLSQQAIAENVGVDQRNREQDPEAQPGNQKCRFWSIYW